MIITSLEHWAEFLRDLRPILAVDTETTIERFPTLLGISVSDGNLAAYCVVDPDRPEGLPVTPIIYLLQEKLDSSKRVIFHNAKFDLKVLERNGLKRTFKYEDTMVAAFNVHEDTNCGPGNGLKALVPYYLGEEMTSFSEIADVKTANLDLLVQYACDDARNTARLYPLLIDRLHDEGVYQVYSAVDRPMVGVLTDMERRGIYVLKEPLAELGQLARGQLTEAEATCLDLLLGLGVIEDLDGRYTEVYEVKNPKKPKEVVAMQHLPNGKRRRVTYTTPDGQTHPLMVRYNPSPTLTKTRLKQFKLGSDQQVGHVLYDVIGLPCDYLTETGRRAVHDRALSALSGQHPFVDALREVRELSKLITTYIEGDGGSGMLQHITEAGRIHANFNLTVTRTGRLSSSNPNLQNIPRPGEGSTKLSERVRSFFVPTPGCVKFVGDFSQIELRLLAHFSNDETMIDLFASGVDLHIGSAAAMFGKPIEECGKGTVERHVAKTINFGVAYGISAPSLAEQVNHELPLEKWITVAQAREFIQMWFERFHGVKEWIEQVKHDARYTVDGSVRNISGRKRRVGNRLSSRHERSDRTRAERQLVNFIIQGSAGDIMKLGMTRFDKAIRQYVGEATYLDLEKRGVWICNQVHDELDVECLPEHLHWVNGVLPKVMEMDEAFGIELRVPMKFDFAQVSSWADK